MSAPVFSYAQAAKGLAPSSQATSSNVSTASSEHGAKDTASPLEPAASQPRPKPTSARADDGVGPKEHDAAKVDAQTMGTKVSVDDHSAATAKRSRKLSQQSSSPAQAALSRASTEKHSAPPKDESTSEPPNDGAVVQDKDSDTSANLDRSTPLGDKDRSKDTDDDWEKVSIPSVAAEKELKAAPLPSVNVWQQRQEVLQAKFKDLTVQRPSPATLSAPRQKSQAPNSDEVRRKPAGKDQAGNDTSTAAARRVNSGSRPGRDQASTQASPHLTSRHSDKAAASIPPPVGDAESWPTPETAITDERRRSMVLEKTDRPDAKNTGQKKWISVPFVPTAKFETQLPPAAHSRRGGRPANRGRGAFAAQADRTLEKSEPGTMGPPPLPKHVSDQDRGRKNEAARNHRASSVPSEGRRAASAASSVRTFSATQAKEPIVSETVPDAPVAAQGEAPIPGNDAPGTGRASRSSSPHTAHNPAATRKLESESKDTTTVPSNARAHPATEGGMRTSYQGERSKGSSHEGFRTSGDYEGERGAPPNREWPKDRATSSREKAESWRERREPRPDRGRGGYRARGGHSGYNNHMSGSHPYTSPLPQNGFDNSKSAASHEGRPATRQTSQPFSSPQNLGPSRGNPRSQSIPIGMMNGGYYVPAQGFPQALSPVQTDMNYGGYGQMPSGIMSAMPYADQLNSYALISMVITQLEYYFSIDNLCKDMFLRKNMDSQGFVALSVIAEFKRIKALTADNQMPYEQLRNICQQVRNIEMVTGDDGEDRLRSRENWKDFVLPIEERLPAAQHEGHALRTHHSRQSSALPSEFPAVNGQRSPPPQMNGFHGLISQQMSPMSYAPIASFDGQGAERYPSHGETQLSDQARRLSTTSPLSKVQSPPSHDLARVASGDLTNGHHASVSVTSENENVFPDEKISELTVVVRDPDYDGDDLPEVPAESTNARVSGLRGGAGSPEQLERFRTLQFGQNMAHSLNRPDQPVFWTKDGEPAQIPIRPGYVHEDYLALHEKALNQRSENHLGGALAVLYAFWSSFLVGNFNLTMYQEFSSMASEDLQNGNDNGKRHLVQLYDALLGSKNLISSRLASDIVLMTRQETDVNRPVWQKLRAAWRNGATNLKTRKRLGDLLNAEERAELDKGA